MVKKWSFIVVAALMGVGCKRGSADSERVGSVRESDAEMRAAMEQARENINEFWRVLDDPSRGEGGFALKIGQMSERGTEYFWLTKIQRDDDKIFGLMESKPTLFKVERELRRVEIDRDSIVDWVYMREGKMHGYYTLAPSSKHMDPAEAAKAKAIMAEQ